MKLSGSLGGWQGFEQMIKFWWRLDLDLDPDADLHTDPDPDSDTGKTCLGGGMHCPSASSLQWTIYIRITLCRVGLYLNFQHFPVTGNAN